MTTLADLPAGADLIASLTQAVRDLSLAYAGTPDERAEASLQRYVAAIRPGIAEALGVSMAAVITGAFASAVMKEKRRLEAGPASRA